jgi:hypothetical protein
MPEIGQQSGRVLVWMVRADEFAFGEELDRALDGRATWTAIAPGTQKGAENARLGEILPAWGGGACLRMKTGGPIIQYLGGYLRAPDNRLVHEPAHGGSLSSGELGYRWLPGELTVEARDDFDLLVRTTLRVLRAHTLANRVEQDGRPYRSGRIGKAATDLVRQHDLELLDRSCRTARLTLRSLV